jgi:hypothetical protein
MFVAEASCEFADPSVDSQIATLKGSGADTFANFSTTHALSTASARFDSASCRPSSRATPTIFA